MYIGTCTGFVAAGVVHNYRYFDSLNCVALFSFEPMRKGCLGSLKNGHSSSLALALNTGEYR
jgi:hypothetical protein